MSDSNDDSQNDGGKSLRNKGNDLSALNDRLEAQGYESGELGDSLKKTTEELERRMEPFRRAQEQMERALEPFRSLQDRMKSLGLSAGEDSAIGRVAKQIADQHRAIEELRPQFSEQLEKPEAPSLPNLELGKIPPNPIFETNKRLERIEERFEQMQGIATDAAQIANGLQGAAAEFLQKFEKAAADNDRTAGRAIRIGVVAVIIAIAMPAVQILYSEFRRTPDNGPAFRSALEDVQAEVAGLREAQTQASAQLEEIIGSSSAETAQVLLEIRDLLSKRLAPIGTVLEAVPQ